MNVFTDKTDSLTYTSGWYSGSFDRQFPAVEKSHPASLGPSKWLKILHLASISKLLHFIFSLYVFIEIFQNNTFNH